MSKESKYSNLRQWGKISFILKNRKESTVIWITCDDYNYKLELIEDFRLHFPKNNHINLSLKQFNENNFVSFLKKQQPNAFKKNHNPTIIHLTEIESQIYPHLNSEGKKGKLIEVLNFEREIIFNDLPFILVFWSETYSQILFQQYAPDFWDWITYKFHFDSPNIIPTQKNTLSVEAIKNETKIVENENYVYSRIARNLHVLKEIDNKRTTDKISLYKSIVSDYYNIGDFLKAEEVIEEALKLENISPNDISYFKFLAGDVYAKLLFFEKAQLKYEEALNDFKEFAKKKPQIYLPYVAMTLNNLAVLHSAKNEFPQTLEKHEEALKIYRKLAKENLRTYLPYVATTLNNLANLHSAKNEFSMALEKYEEALKIFKEFAKDNPKTYLPDVATTLNNLSVLHTAKSEFPQALEKHEEVLKIYRNLAKENPRIFEIDYAKTLLFGVYKLKKDKSDLILAKEILLKYENIPHAKRLLELISEIENNDE